MNRLAHLDVGDGLALAPSELELLVRAHGIARVHPVVLCAEHDEDIAATYRRGNLLRAVAQTRVQ